MGMTGKTLARLFERKSLRLSLPRSFTLCYTRLASAMPACQRQTGTAPPQKKKGTTYYTPFKPVQRRQALELLPALQGPAEGDFVGVLQVTSHGKAPGEPGHLDAQRDDEALQVHGRGLALQRWV